MKKLLSLKARRYATRLIDLNWYLASILGATLADKIDVTELNDIFLKSTPNSWSRQSYVRGFDWESILFKNTANMFERMETAEYIYNGVLEPSY